MNQTALSYDVPFPQQCHFCLISRYAERNYSFENQIHTVIDVAAGKDSFIFIESFYIAVLSNLMSLGGIQITEKLLFHYIFCNFLKAYSLDVFFISDDRRLSQVVCFHYLAQFIAVFFYSPDHFDPVFLRFSVTGKGIILGCRILLGDADIFHCLKCSFTVSFGDVIHGRHHIAAIDIVFKITSQKFSRIRIEFLSRDHRHIVCLILSCDFFFFVYKSVDIFPHAPPARMALWFRQMFDRKCVVEEKAEPVHSAVDHIIHILSPRDHRIEGHSIKQLFMHYHCSAKRKRGPF